MKKVRIKIHMLFLLLLFVGRPATEEPTTNTRRWSTAGGDGSSSSEPLSPILESTTQQAGRLFSNFSSFISRKQREISQAMEENHHTPNTDVASGGSQSDSDYVDVGSIFPQKKSQE